jgi:tRNA A-37 threonylcarbamoyl transferase component Bud32
MTDDDFESRVRAFEQAWQRDRPCGIREFLASLSFPDAAERRRLLVELICVDLEFRWRNRAHVEPAPLTRYVEQFPELGSVGQLPLEVLCEEYRARWRWGNRPSPSAYLLELPARHAELRAALVDVQAELDRESSGFPTRFVRPGPAPLPIEIDPEGPLLSHKDFLLRRLIGAGRMGKVYEADQRGSSRAVAVKFLRKPFRPVADVVRRFIGEARTVAKLEHPNIVGTQGLGRTPGGSYFIVMELVNGSNLAVLASRRPIAVVEAVGWVVDACHALEHAHDRGIVHCDVKPANLLCDGHGRVRVTDFGLARSLAENNPWAAEVEGTAPFMAPEQTSRWWGPIDARTDVYGLGAVLFTLLTGRPPFVGRTIPDVLAQVVSATPVTAASVLRPGLPEPLSAICAASLAKAPEERFASARELRATLEVFGR